MTVIDTSKIILAADIQAGDEVRKHYLPRTAHDAYLFSDYWATADGDAFGGRCANNVYELLNRPRVPTHAKGKTLWAVTDWTPRWFMVGDKVTVAKDYFEGDDYMAIDGVDLTGGYFKPDHFTDVEPVRPETYVSVPQSAIDALCAIHEEAAHAIPSRGTSERQWYGVEAFLQAVPK